VRLDGLGQLKKSTSSGLEGRLPACSIVPQPTTVPLAPRNKKESKEKRRDAFICKSEINEEEGRRV
jgi:hypothetical protein